MKTFSIYELSNGQPSRFYNSSTDSFTSDVKKATLYTKEEAESKKKELEKPRTDQYQKTGKNYTELHTGDLFKKGILKENKTMKITKSQLKEIIREELTQLNEKLINNPNAVLKGKTIQSFKSNGYGKGYTMILDNGLVIDITGGGAGAQNTVYITKRDNQAP
jgi:hypothetical protein